MIDAEAGRQLVAVARGDLHFAVRGGARGLNGLEPIQGGRILVDGTEVHAKTTDLNKLRRKIGNLKISKVGGLTKANLMRDICVASGIPMTIEDTWGGDIVTATIAALALSTPERFCFSATDFNSYGTVDFADGAPKRVNGRMTAPNVPGLGVSPKCDVLGEGKSVEA